MLSINPILLVVVAVAGSLALPDAAAFTPPPSKDGRGTVGNISRIVSQRQHGCCSLDGYVRHRWLASPRSVRTITFAAPRYGPSKASPESGNSMSSGDATSEGLPGGGASLLDWQKQQFRSLVEQCMAVTQPEHLPRILGNNMDLVMSLRGEDGTQVISNLLDETRGMGGEAGLDGDLLYTQTLQTVETILSFAEDFVQQAVEMDGHNKRLLGKIIKALAKNGSEGEGGNGMLGGDGRSDAAREESLDLVMEEEKASFTPGFLRHLEGECDRIAGASRMTPESARLLQILRVIQTRVLEELGRDMGEAASVLGQLMGYDNEDELLGVLDTGLAVRGVGFAMEMASLTEEALAGFQGVQGGVEPELVDRVTRIDTRLREFVDEANKFQ